MPFYIQTKWQYQMMAYRRILAEHGIIQSMSRKGNCLDNAAMESFFGRLKTECFYGREFNSREEIVDAVRDYLDYYNHRRIQLKLKGLSQIQYRKQSFKHTFLYQLLTTLFTYYSHSILYYFPK